MLHTAVGRTICGLTFLALASGAASATQTTISETGHNCMPATSADAALLDYSNRFGPYTNGTAVSPKVVCHLPNPAGVLINVINITYYNRTNSLTTRCTPVLVNSTGSPTWTGPEMISGGFQIPAQLFHWSVPSIAGNLYVTCNIGIANGANVSQISEVSLGNSN